MARDWEAVVAELVRVRGASLLRYATLVSGRRDEAPDLVQDALVKTFGRLRNGFTVDNAEPYVRRAIMTLWLDRARRSTRWRAIAPLEYRPDEQPSPATGVDARLDLHRELERLSPRERACLVLRYYDDLKVDDVAATLGISAGTVKRYLSDGLAKMAIALADDGTAEDRTGTAPRPARNGARRREGDRRGRV